jgi:hypothetical protein
MASLVTEDTNTYDMETLLDKHGPYSSKPENTCPLCYSTQEELITQGQVMIVPNCYVNESNLKKQTNSFCKQCFEDTLIDWFTNNESATGQFVKNGCRFKSCFDVQCPRCLPGRSLPKPIETSRFFTINDIKSMKFPRFQKIETKYIQAVIRGDTYLQVENAKKEFEKEASNTIAINQVFKKCVEILNDNRFSVTCPCGLKVSRGMACSSLRCNSDERGVGGCGRYICSVCGQATNSTTGEDFTVNEVHDHISRVHGDMYLERDNPTLFNDLIVRNVQTKLHDYIKRLIPENTEMTLFNMRRQIINCIFENNEENPFYQSLQFMRKGDLLLSLIGVNNMTQNERDSIQA